MYETHAGVERKKRDSNMFNSVLELSIIGQRWSTNVHSDKHIHAHNSSLRIFFWDHVEEIQLISPWKSFKKI